MKNIMKNVRKLVRKSLECNDEKQWFDHKYLKKLYIWISYNNILIFL